MEINISKSEIFNEVEKRSSFEGSMIPDRYDNMWANPDKGTILDSYWVEGYTAAVQLLKRYLTGSTINYNLSQYDKDEVVTINATMPARYNSLLDGSVATDIKMMVACNVLHGWFEVSNPEVAAKYNEESKGYSEDLRVKLLYRSEPSKTLVLASTDSDNIKGEESKLAEAGSDLEGISTEGAKLAEAGSDLEGISTEGAKLAEAGSDSTTIGVTEAALASATTDNDTIESTGVKLSEASVDGEDISLNEGKLAQGEDDVDNLSVDESQLGKGKSDEEMMCNHDFGMKYPSEDDVILEQRWGRCCCRL